MSQPRTLFVGKASAAICWYRCALPAKVLGHEWVGVYGNPPDVRVVTGEVAKPLALDDLFEYDVVVLQQPESGWTALIRRLQAAGVVVLFEIDDYLQAVRKMASHEGRHHWDKKRIAGIERNMRIADGLICSTEYIARRYRAFNRRVFVCRNGIDFKRYEHARAPRAPGVTIGWAGGVGHVVALKSWMGEVTAVMRERPDTRFVTVGQPFAQLLEAEFGEERAIAVPFSHLETYPASMTVFDLAIAPSAHNNLFRGKSDLRWLEASALGIPLIADPDVYPDIEHGVTGFHASTPAEAGDALRALVGDDALRARVGAAAHAHVGEHRSIEVAAQSWAAVLEEVAAERVAA